MFETEVNVCSDSCVCAITKRYYQDQDIFYNITLKFHFKSHICYSHRLYLTLQK